MDWMHNPIGNMYGPHFLAFYGVVIVSVFIISKLFYNFFDHSHLTNLPQVPTVVDPYEVAYLRGGENEVVRLVVLDLIQRGYLERSGKQHTGEKIARAQDHPDERHLNELEKSVFSFYKSSHYPGEVFQLRHSNAVKNFIKYYQETLEQENLLLNKFDSRTLKMIMMVGLIIIIGLGVYKLIVALATYHFNVFFLFAMDITAAFLYCTFCSPPRMSLRGRKYLERLQLAYERLKGKDIKGNLKTTDPSLLLMVGIFGMGVLIGTVYSYYSDMFKKANYSSGSGCGSSCGGGGGSCGGGGGCGGCGG